MAARRAELLASGRRARARILHVDHGVDVDDVVVLSEIRLLVDDDGITTVLQAVPPTLVARVVAGALVDVLVRDDQVMIEWSY